MSAESISHSNKQYPTKLAPFRYSESLSPFEEIGLVSSLEQYVEDPYTARFLEKDTFGINDGMPDNWDVSYERALSKATADALNVIAHEGKTFLSQELARYLVESPLSKTFNYEMLHTMAEVSMDGSPGGLSEAEDKALTLAAKYSLKRYGDAIDQDLLDVYKEELQSRRSSVFNKHRTKAFAVLEDHFVKHGYLSEGQLENDEIFLMYQYLNNLVAMQGRMWHMAYEIPKDIRASKIDPFTFEMQAVGRLENTQATDGIYEKFINRKPVDYKDIIKAGLLYAPVQTSIDSVGFFEESGKLVQLFRPTDGLGPGEKATPFLVDERVKELLVDADEEEVENTVWAYRKIAGSLQVRNSMEIALGMRLSDISLDDQIFLCKLLLRATPEQMQSVIKQGPDVIVAVARALEFGDDYGDILLDLAESSDKEAFASVVGDIEQVRQSGLRISEHFRSEDPLDAIIAERMPIAFIKRTTELLALARQDDIEVVLEPLSAISDATEQIAESLENDTFSHADVTSEFGSFRSENLPVTINSRPHGHNARLGFTVRIGKQRLSIRLDYEEGNLSLDMGSTAKKDVNVSDISALVGNTLADGEAALAQYRSERSGEGVTDILHGNHVREAFLDLPFLQPEEFAGVVNRFMYRLRYRDQILKLGQTATAPQIAA